jgi:integrase
VRWELLSRNVAELVQPPQIAKTPRDTWTAEQALYFISTLGDHPLRGLFMLAIYAGMRKSELLGLRWQDVDYDRNTVSIVQTIVATSHGSVVGQAKTAAGRRSVQIAGEVVLALRRQRTEQAKLAAHLGQPLPALVFTTRHLTNIGPNNLLRDFKRLSAQAGLPPISFHALRHTHATILLQQGVHPKVVSERLGHSRTGVTMDVYSHVLPDSQAQAVTAFDKAMKRKV